MGATHIVDCCHLSGSIRPMEVYVQVLLMRNVALQRGFNFIQSRCIMFRALPSKPLGWYGLHMFVVLWICDGKHGQNKQSRISAEVTHIHDIHVTVVNVFVPVTIDDLDSWTKLLVFCIST